MSSIFWYSGLAIISLAIAAFTVYKKRNFSTLIAFYLFAASTTFTGEYFALVVFQGYIYKPGMFAEFFRDNLVGHMIINLTLWPGTAIAVWAFSLRYGWILLVTAGYLLAEYVFVKLGIYEQYWWRYYMSGIIVVAFHIITKLWFGKLNKKMYGSSRISSLSRYITLFFIGQVIIQVPIALLLLSGKLYYTVGWVENIYRDHTLFTVIYSSGISICYVFFAGYLKKWFWKLVPILIYLICDGILLNMKILVFQNGWNFFYLAIIHCISLVLFILSNKYTLIKSVAKILC